MKREYKSEAEASSVLKEAIYLAWKAAGGPQGMGFLQDKGLDNRNPSVTLARTQAQNKTKTSNPNQLICLRDLECDTEHSAVVEKWD